MTALCFKFLLNSNGIDRQNCLRVSGCYDKTIKVWDLNTGRLLNTLEGHSDYVSSVAITSDNSKIVSASRDNTIKFWNRDKGKCYLRYKFDEGMVSISLSKNRNFIALGGEGGDLYLGSFSA